MYHTVRAAAQQCSCARSCSLTCMRCCTCWFCMYACISAICCCTSGRDMASCICLIFSATAGSYSSTSRQKRAQLCASAVGEWAGSMHLLELCTFLVPGCLCCPDSACAAGLLPAAGGPCTLSKANARHLQAETLPRQQLKAVLLLYKYLHGLCHLLLHSIGDLCCMNHHTPPTDCWA